MDIIRDLVPANVRDYVAVAVIAGGGCYGVIKLMGCVCKSLSAWRVRQRWRNTKKDVVVVHRIPPSLACPNASPFVVKLETFLRMAKIPYEIDLKDAMGPKGKTPWITLNGEHITDSQLIIELLEKKYETKIGNNYSDEEKAISTMARVVLDEHFYWGLCLWRYVYGPEKGFGPEKIYAWPKILLLLMSSFIKKWVNQAAWYQGIGRHSEADIVKMSSDDLRAVSHILGNKKFILGEEPTTDDCAIFGQLAQVVYCAPGSPYEKLLDGELNNLKRYCIRMKEAYWPDWDDCVFKKGA